MEITLKDSALIATNKGGRPSKYQPGTVKRILAALDDGLTQKQACIAAGICENTLATWRDKHPELQAKMAEAREQARQKALARIKAAGESGDWRASEAFLRMSFAADYRQGGNVNVNATATIQQAGLVCDEATRKRLIELREKIAGRHHDE